MADILIREATAFQSNPLCPVPQYWNGTGYEKVQGANGAPRTIIYDAFGVPLLTVTNAGYVQSIDGANATLGAKTDTAATTDTGTFSLIAFIKRSLQNWTSLLAKIPALGPALKAASIPVNIASDQTVPVSASSLPLPTGAATESTISAINTKLGAALPLPTGAATEATIASILAKIIASPATEATLATMSAKLPSSGQATMANSKPVVIASDQPALPVSAATLPLPTGAATESTLSTIAAELGVVGGQANAWSAASVLVGGDSAPIDCRYQNIVSAFGTANAATTITAWVSQDNVTFYATSNNVVLAGSGDFHFSFQSAARYIRLRSSAAATITATIAGK